ncbi:MAG TPA: hypothetical protein VGA24_10415 [Steroidobacteraceae bacterium]
MRRSSMKSFAVTIEPAAGPRLAAVAFLVHLAAAASPWFARAEPLIAAALSVLAIAGLVSTLGRVPGGHSALCALAFDGRGCRVRLTGRRRWLRAKVGTGARAYASLVLVEVVVAGKRLGWLLPRWALPPDDFRRLKARIRLTC